MRPQLSWTRFSSLCSVASSKSPFISCIASVPSTTSQLRYFSVHHGAFISGRIKSLPICRRQIQDPRQFSTAIIRMTAAMSTHSNANANAHVNGSVKTGAQGSADISREVGGEKNMKMLEKISRDFRSDTITVPTDAMLIAGLTATRGDDVYRDDPSTIALEERVARLAGKEAALFCVSGTQTNQLAIRAHLTQPPHSVLLDHRAHVHKMEAGGIAVFSQATSHSIVPANGRYITAEEVEENITLGSDIHTAPTRLVSLENTLSGMIFPQEEIQKIADFIKPHNIPLHLDGARIWEVAAADIGRRGAEANEENLQECLTRLCGPFATVSLCLSKGIGAPIGSVLVGPKALIERARWFRKMFGGGIRQAGAIASAADVALTTVFPRLYRTHALARKLADGFTALGGGLLNPVETNMVWLDFRPLHIPLALVQERAEARNLVARGSRYVIHHQITEQAVDDLLDVIRELKEEVARNGTHGLEVNALGDRPQEKVVNAGY